MLCIIQSRMNSLRYPGKVLMEVSCKPLLERVYNRVCLADNISKIVIATSNQISDDPIDLFCEYSAGYVIEIRNEDLNNVSSFLSENVVGYSEIGEIIKENIEINSKKFDYFDIINNYHNNFEKIIN